MSLSHDTSRRDLFSLRTFFKESEKPIRPPYAADASQFDAVCPACDAPCVASCETRIIVRDANGCPSLDFSDDGCTFCEACAEACPEPVLDAGTGPRLNAAIDLNVLSCLSWNKTMCFTCKDRCDVGAIAFFRLFQPEIDASACTKCGMCISACPVSAITVKAMH